MYGACFGVELTMNNVAALYFHDHFGLGMAAAGMSAGLHGLMNIFARTLGGYVSDRVGARCGMPGRVGLLARPAADRRACCSCCFARTSVLLPAVAAVRGVQPVRRDGRGRDLRGRAADQPPRARLGGRASSARAATSARCSRASCSAAKGSTTATALLYLGIAVDRDLDLALLVPFTREEGAEAAAPEPSRLTAAQLVAKPSNRVNRTAIRKRDSEFHPPRNAEDAK